VIPAHLDTSNSMPQNRGVPEYASEEEHYARGDDGVEFWDACELVSL
jgi:hypothetical protein